MKYHNIGGNMKKAGWAGFLGVIILGQFMSCASFFAEKTIKISSTPENTTAIILDPKGNTINEVRTPTRVELPRKSGAYTIEFSEAGYLPDKKIVRKNFNHWFWLNILISGVGLGSTLVLEDTVGYGLSAIGLIGALYDIFTGSVTTIKQPQVTMTLKMTPEALAAQEEQRKAEAEKRAQMEEERKLAEEARQKTIDEANKYDASKFAIVPNNFKPADYTKVDLFKAALSSQNLPNLPNRREATISQVLSDRMELSRNFILLYVSELTFVQQNGTNIEFTSDDNAISQYMTIGQRSGLQAGQKVNVYYRISRVPLTTWDVVAIERR
jgi:hypothetical protein